MRCQAKSSSQVLQLFIAFTYSKKKKKKLRILVLGATCIQNLAAKETVFVFLINYGERLSAFTQMKCIKQI
jgi:hypothetical protein